MRCQAFVSLLFVAITVLFSANLLGQTVDDFNRSSLGSNWTADPEFVIVNSSMLDNSATTASWGYLAVYNAIVNPTEVSYTYAASPYCDVEGANSGAIAVYLDAPSTAANGYAILRRYSTIDLHLVINGVMDRANAINSATPTQPTPGPGTTIKVIPSTDASGHHFDVYINGVLDGRVNDTAKRSGNGSTLYSGVVLYGSRTNNIDNFTLKTATTSTITVTAPNGGETWYANSTRTITWSSSNFSGDVKIELSTDGGTTWSRVITALTPNSGTYSWTIPVLTGMPLANCRVRISNTTGGGPLDVSNAAFTIAEALIPKLARPNGGEMWIANTTQEITWQGFVSASVRIRYRINNTDPWTDITTSTPNDGSFIWTVPAQFTTTAKIKISDTADILEADESDAYFTITANAKLSIPDASGEPSTTGNVIYLWLNNQVNIRGIFFDLVDNPAYMTGERVIAMGRASGFTVSYRETGTAVRVAMVHMSGQVIPVGNSAIAQIVYSTSGAPTIGSHSTLTLQNVTVSDASGNLVSPELVAGKFYFLEMGNLDGLNAVDLVDLAILRDLILKKRAPTGYEMLAGDLDHDNDIDLFDFMITFDRVYHPIL
jgi:hypothetical protein